MYTTSRKSSVYNDHVKHSQSQTPFLFFFPKIFQFVLQFFPLELFFHLFSLLASFFLFFSFFERRTNEWHVRTLPTFQMVTTIHPLATPKDAMSTTKYIIINHPWTTQHQPLKCCSTRIGLRNRYMFRPKVRMKVHNKIQWSKA